MQYLSLSLIFVVCLTVVSANPLQPPPTQRPPKCCESRHVEHFSVTENSVTITTTRADVNIAVLDDIVQGNLDITFDTENSDEPTIGDQLLVMSTVDFSAVAEDTDIDYQYDVTYFYASACGGDNQGIIEFENDGVALPDVTLFFWNGEKWINSLDNC